MAKDLKSRLLSFVCINDESGCWDWTGSKSRGYGQLSSRFNQPPHKAHRLSYQLFVGPIPDAMVVRHKCDNPGCINPKHLEIGSHKDNVMDRVGRGRTNPISLLNLHPGEKGVHGAGRKSKKELSRGLS